MHVYKTKSILFLGILFFSLSGETTLAVTNTGSMNFISSESQFLSVPDSASLSITGDMTIESWFKSRNPDADQNIVAKWHNPTGESYGFRYLGSTNKLSFYASDGTQYFFGGEINYKIKADTWYHLAVTYNAQKGTARFFVDGKQVGTKKGYPTSLLDGDANLIIGSTQNGSGEFMDGLLDEVRIWNDIRTQVEIESNMYNSLTGSEANLAAYWNLNATSSDATTNGNDFTANGATYSGEPAHHISCNLPGSNFLLTSSAAITLPNFTCSILGIF